MKLIHIKLVKGDSKDIYNVICQIKAVLLNFLFIKLKNKMHDGFHRNMNCVDHQILILE